MHPDHAAAYRHYSLAGDDLAHRLEVGRQSGVPEAALAGYAERAQGLPSQVAELIEPDRALVAGVTVDSDLGTWHVHETPGHAPSHVCLYQPERRLLVSGDHLLGRISLFFDHDGPDPVGRFLESLHLVAGLRARLTLSGHGKPFLDVPGHIEGTRRAVHAHLAAAERALAGGPRTATDIALEVHGDAASEHDPAWLVPQTLCYLEHLEAQGRLQRASDGDVELWRAAPQP